MPSPARSSSLRNGRVRGYAALYEPHGPQPEILADFVFDPAAPAHLVEDVVADTVARFRQEATSLPGAFLRTFIGTAQQPAIDALIRHGARREGQFIRTRKPLDGEDADALDAEAIDGLTLLAWPEIVSRGLLEQVRQLQFDTFLEHFGNMSKTPDAWQHHIESRSFTPDFSIAAVDRRRPGGRLRARLHLHRGSVAGRGAQRPHRLHRRTA